MGKRFGRNQKRKLSKALADMTQYRDNFSYALTLEQGLVSEQRGIIRELNNSLRVVADCLGENFYGLPPIQRRVNEMYPGQKYRMPKPISRDQLGFLQGRELAQLVEYSVYQLDPIKPNMQMDKFTGSVHLMLETPDGRVQYAVSASAWEELKRDRRLLAQRFVPMVAEELANFISRGER